jgi:protein-L-isoaspartate(D-aspartate) O-methyltransferase
MQRPARAGATMITTASEIGLVILLALAGVALLVCGGTRVCHSSPPDWKTLREEMVKHQIEARGVTNPRVLEVLRSVPRHRFVPESDRSRAYQDRPLSIGHGQTISQPYIVAVMTELLDPRPGDRVLEVGTGSGYQAAVLSRLVEKVFSIEIIPELAESARIALAAAGYRNVQVITGDGYAGLPEHAPFDGIIVTAAPEEVPKPLIEQLAVGARLVIPVGGWSQDLRVLERTEAGVHTKTLFPVRFVPLVRSKD